MSRIKEITVSLDLTVQPKQYQSVKLGITVATQVDDESEEGSTNQALLERIESLRTYVSEALRVGLHEEVEKVYGKAVADYCVNQAPTDGIARRPV